MRRRISYKFIIVSSIVGYGLSVAFHFLYEWSGKMPLTALVSPVNESIFQHIKLSFYPLVIVWLLCYPLLDLPKAISLWEMLTATLISILICIFSVLSVYYILAGGFRLYISLVNIVMQFIGILLGQCVSSRIVTTHKLPKACGVSALLLLTAGMFGLCYFTVFPAKLPIMLPPDTM